MRFPFAHPAEAAYARLLGEHGIPWESEPQRAELERLLRRGRR